jgi:hypothetical protein
MPATLTRDDDDDNNKKKLPEKDDAYFRNLKPISEEKFALLTFADRLEASWSSLGDK